MGEKKGEKEEGEVLNDECWTGGNESGSLE